LLAEMPCAGTKLRQELRRFLKLNQFGFQRSFVNAREAHMGKINLGRVVLGGLLAGLIISIGEYLWFGVLLAKSWTDAMAALNRPAIGTEGNSLFIILFFALGIFSVWVYAAIRPRFGAGPMTALCAGLVVWFLAAFFPAAGMLPMNLFPRSLLFYGMLWELFEFPIATLAGAWIYKEQAQ
jgi:hypothetical protein